MQAQLEQRNGKIFLYKTISKVAYIKCKLNQSYETRIKK